MEHGHVRTKDLSTDRNRGRERDLGKEGTVGREAMEEAASDPLHGNSVIPVLHVRTGRSDEESEVREVPATLRDTTGCMLEGVKSGKLEVGEMEYPVTMNQTRSYMTGEEGGSGK
jgi:hypothetical protein